MLQNCTFLLFIILFLNYVSNFKAELFLEIFLKIIYSNDYQIYLNPSEIEPNLKINYFYIYSSY